MTCGDGRILTTAALPISMLRPYTALTRTRASWRAPSRGDTQTVIGNPVDAGYRLAISKLSIITALASFRRLYRVRRRWDGGYNSRHFLQPRIDAIRDRCRARPTSDVWPAAVYSIVWTARPPGLPASFLITPRHHGRCHFKNDLRYYNT